jgi:hypothetical protein
VVVVVQGDEDASNQKGWKSGVPRTNEAERLYYRRRLAIDLFAVAKYLPVER